MDKKTELLGKIAGIAYLYEVGLISALDAQNAIKSALEAAKFELSEDKIEG